MSDDDPAKDQNADVLEFIAKPKREKRPYTFYWVLRYGIDEQHRTGPLLSVVFTTDSLWKVGDCVKITMEKVGESD